MKTERLDYSLDYMKFTVEADGETFTDELASQFNDILSGDLKAEKAVADYIRQEKLESYDNSGFNEMSSYPETRCLVNYFNIKDKGILKQIETWISSMRIAELFVRPKELPFSFDYL